MYDGSALPERAIFCRINCPLFFSDAAFYNLKLSSRGKNPLSVTRLSNTCLAVKWSIHTDDEALIKACLCHDRMAQEMLYQKYFQDAYRTCNRYLPQHADVMAVVNEGFLKVFSHLKYYNPRVGKAGAWIHRIMVNTAIDYLRRENRTGIVASLSGENYMDPAVDNDILADINSEDLLLMVKRLPHTTRAVFNMYVMEGYSHQEIADQLNFSAGTSRWHLTEAKKRLQHMIRQKEKIVSV